VIDSRLADDLELAGDLVGTGFEGWGDDLLQEFQTHELDGHVGS
jgi:hypothetical protein